MIRNAKQALTEKLSPHGQQHLLAFWDQLAEEQRTALANEIDAIDLALVDRLFQQGGSEVDWAELASRAVAPPAVRLDDENPPFPRDQARQRAAGALDEGRVGVVLVAGGQGTRLGFDHAKGMYAIGPVSGASLFQIHIEKILAVSRHHGVSVPLYLMTSPATHNETVAYLDAHDRFGLPREDLTIFCQGTMPAVDAATGRILLADRGHVALSPDGHGGTLAALARSGALDDMRRRELQQLFYFQVDNPLCPICDPTLIGYHLLCQSEMTTLVVAKQSPQDRVGNVVAIDGRLHIIEYSDLPDEAAERRRGDGSLEIWAGSIAVHVFDVAFLEAMRGRSDALPFHVARKKVACIDAAGEPVQPAEPNALKFERFIFDLLPSARQAIVIEGRSRDVFAPLKNASGAAEDTPEAVRAAMVAMHREWLESAGAKLEGDPQVEISPLFALDAEEVTRKMEPGVEIASDCYFR